MVTDHAALQWARTYENANRRLAGWGAIFSAYAPGLEIIHRAGKKHANVDPLSRLSRQTPEHTSPLRDDIEAINIAKEAAESQEPARKFSFAAERLTDCVVEAFKLETRRQRAAREALEKMDNLDEAKEPVTWSEPKTQPKRPSEVEQDRAKGNLHIHLEGSVLNEWLDGYARSAAFKEIWNDERATVDTLKTGYRYFRDENGLLYFKDTDFQPRLCVPENFCHRLLERAHEAAGESAHCGAEKLWLRLSPRFYWKRMKVNLVRFCRSCDICQKIKHSNFNKYGYLIPNPIPFTPYASIPMDFIVNLPMGGIYNAIFVIVDWLTKHANFIPTSSGLTAEEFAHLFVKWVVSRYGIPESVICDRDPRWTSDFWRAVAKELKTDMLFSSPHHPQTDGQTEIVNRYLETMLWAYVNTDKSDWPDWLHLLEFAYNSTVHSSTGQTPFHLLLGYMPRSLIDFLPSVLDGGKIGSVRRGTVEFSQNLAMHRDIARQAIAAAQHAQATQHNKSRKEVPEIKEGNRVLVNPHSLEWLESRGEGAKLNPRWIGQFEVMEKVNANIYRLRLPSSYPGSPILNIAHLKKYVEPEGASLRTLMKEHAQRKDASEEYEVERILGHKRVGADNKLKYLIRWKGYGPQFDQWEEARMLKNAPRILKEYHQHAGL